MMISPVVVAPRVGGHPPAVRGAGRVAALPVAGAAAVRGDHGHARGAAVPPRHLRAARHPKLFGREQRAQLEVLLHHLLLDGGLGGAQQPVGQHLEIKYILFLQKYFKKFKKYFIRFECQNK